MCRVVLAMRSVVVIRLTTRLTVLLSLLPHGPHRRTRLLMRRRPELPLLLLTLLRLSSRSRLTLS